MSRDSSPDLRLRSSIPGRQRWDVKAIFRNAARARALESDLAALPGVLRVQANPATGRLLILYSPQSTHDFEAIIDRSLAAPSFLASPPTDQEPRKGPLLRLLARFLPSRRELAVPPLISLSGHVVHILQGHSFVATVNSVRGEAPRFLRSLGIRKRRSRLLAMTGLSLLLTGADLALQYYRKRAWQRLARNTQHRIRTALITRLEEQDLEFFDHHSTGPLISTVTNDTDRIGEFIEQAGDDLIEKPTTILVSGVILLRTSPWLALLGLLPLPLSALLTRTLEPHVGARFARFGEIKDRFSRMLENNIPGIATVKSLTAEDLEIRRLSACDAELEEAAVTAESASTLLSVLSQGTFTASLAMATHHSGRLAGAGKISSSKHTRAMYWFPQMVMAFTGLERLRGVYRSAEMSAANALRILDSRPKITGGPVRLEVSTVQGDVKFENVSFGYDPAFKVLDDVSFQLSPGENLAIVGPTGSGKSSLLKLLLRFYEPDSGRILLDGHNIRELDPRDLRRAVSFVGQEIYIFEGTIRDNLLFGSPDASPDQVVRTITEIAPDLIQTLPGGVDAEAGERGTRLSGGAKQRVAVARALLKGSPVLALDEVTSQLDYKTERLVKEHLTAGTAAKTVIMVAHRLATIRDAHRIIVLDAGRIREQGTHDELLALGGLYASIWNLQSGEDGTLGNLEVRLDRQR